MILSRISILNFKNLAQSELSFSSNINCFLGHNGAGKTNVLDAIYYLSLTKSAMSMSDGQCVKHDSDFFMLKGDYESNPRSELMRRESIVCGFKANSSGKTFKRNGKEYDKLSEHIGLLPIVMVSPADTSLIQESGDERRKFINQFLSQIDNQYLSKVIKYNSLLAERNKLLKLRLGADYDDVVKIIDMQLDEVAAVIYDVRSRFVSLLSPLVSQYYSVISGDRESVEISYRSHLQKGSMLELLEQSVEKDRAMGHTTVGIHRDDVVMKIMGYPIRKYGSQGQQKSMLIALKLAQYDLIYQTTGIKPMLLLDDVFDKLDMSRVEQLIELVSGDNFGQIFITDSNKVRMDGVLSSLNVSYALFGVDQGDVVCDISKSKSVINELDDDENVIIYQSAKGDDLMSEYTEDALMHEQENEGSDSHKPWHNISAK